MYSGMFTPSPGAVEADSGTPRQSAIHSGHCAVFRYDRSSNRIRHRPDGREPARDRDPISSGRPRPYRHHRPFDQRLPGPDGRRVPRISASGHRERPPGSAVPPPIVEFLETHPGAKTFVETPKPIPTSYARQAYFAITAFKFINAAGESRFGRFRIRPEAGIEFLTPEQVQKKTSDFLAAEMSARLTRGPVVFRVLVQLAEPGDNVTDSTSIWPETRTEAEFGILTIKERVDELAPERRNDDL